MKLLLAALSLAACVLSAAAQYGGECGPGVAACATGLCCSKWGFCGTAAAYCDEGCQADFGHCWVLASPGPATAPALPVSNNGTAFQVENWVPSLSSSPTVTVSASTSPSPSASATATSSATSTASSSPTATATPTATSTATCTATPTATPTSTATSSQAHSQSSTSGTTSSASATATSSATSTASPSPTATATPTSTLTSTFASAYTPSTPPVPTDDTRTVSQWSSASPAPSVTRWRTETPSPTSLASNPASHSKSSSRQATTSKSGTASSTCFRPSVTHAPSASPASPASSWATTESTAPLPSTSRRPESPTVSASAWHTDTASPSSSTGTTPGTTSTSRRPESPTVSVSTWHTDTASPSSSTGATPGTASTSRRPESPTVSASAWHTDTASPSSSTGVTSRTASISRTPAQSPSLTVGSASASTGASASSLSVSKSPAAASPTVTLTPTRSIGSTAHSSSSLSPIGTERPSASSTYSPNTSSAPFESVTAGTSASAMATNPNTHTTSSLRTVTTTQLASTTEATTSTSTQTPSHVESVLVTSSTGFSESATADRASASPSPTPPTDASPTVSYFSSFSETPRTYSASILASPTDSSASLTGSSVLSQSGTHENTAIVSPAASASASCSGGHAPSRTPSAVTSGSSAGAKSVQPVPVPSPSPQPVVSVCPFGQVREYVSVTAEPSVLHSGASSALNLSGAWTASCTRNNSATSTDRMSALILGTNEPSVIGDGASAALSMDYRALPVHSLLQLQLQLLWLGNWTSTGAPLTILVDDVVLGSFNSSQSEWSEHSGMPITAYCTMAESGSGDQQQQYSTPGSVVSIKLALLHSSSTANVKFSLHSSDLVQQSGGARIGVVSVNVSVSDGMCRERSDIIIIPPAEPTVCIAKQHPWTSDVLHNGFGRAVAIFVSIFVGALIALVLLYRHFVTGFQVLQMLQPAAPTLESKPRLTGFVPSRSTATLVTMTVCCLIDVLFRTAAFSWGVVPWERVGLGAAAAFFHRFLLIVPTWWLLLIAILAISIVVFAFYYADRRALSSSSATGKSSIVPASAVAGLLLQSSGLLVPVGSWLFLGLGRLLTSVLFVPAVYLLLNPWLCTYATVGIRNTSPHAYYPTSDCGSFFECFGFWHWVALIATLVLLAALLIGMIGVTLTIPNVHLVRIGLPHLLLLNIPLRLVMAWSGRLLIHFSPCWSVMLSLTCNVALLCVSIVWLVCGGAALCHPRVVLLLLAVGIWCVMAGVGAAVVLVRHGGGGACADALGALGMLIVLLVVATAWFCYKMLRRNALVGPLPKAAVAIMVSASDHLPTEAASPADAYSQSELGLGVGHGGAYAGSLGGYTSRARLQLPPLAHRPARPAVLVDANGCGPVSGGDRAVAVGQPVSKRLERTTLQKRNGKMKHGQRRKLHSRGSYTEATGMTRTLGQSLQRNFPCNAKVHSLVASDNEPQEPEEAMLRVFVSSIRSSPCSINNLKPASDVEESDSESDLCVSPSGSEFSGSGSDNGSACFAMELHADAVGGTAHLQSSEWQFSERSLELQQPEPPSQRHGEAIYPYGSTGIAASHSQSSKPGSSPHKLPPPSMSSAQSTMLLGPELYAAEQAACAIEARIAATLQHSKAASTSVFEVTHAADAHHRNQSTSDRLRALHATGGGMTHAEHSKRTHQHTAASTTRTSSSQAELQLDIRAELLAAELTTDRIEQRFFAEAGESNRNSNCGTGGQLGVDCLEAGISETSSRAHAGVFSLTELTGSGSGSALGEVASRTAPAPARTSSLEAELSAAEATTNRIEQRFLSECLEVQVGVAGAVTGTPSTLSAHTLAATLRPTPPGLSGLPVTESTDTLAMLTAVTVMYSQAGSSFDSVSSNDFLRPISALSALTVASQSHSSSKSGQASVTEAPTSENQNIGANDASLAGSETDNYEDLLDLFAELKAGEAAVSALHRRLQAE